MLHNIDRGDIDRGVLTMSGTESEALPAQPDEAQISSFVSSIVLKAKESNSLRCVFTKPVTVGDHEL